MFGALILVLTASRIAQVMARDAARGWTRLRRGRAADETVRSHWFAQCYGWRVGPEASEVQAWPGPGVWVGLGLGAAVLVGGLTLAMIVPAMAARVPGDPTLGE